MPQNGIVSEIGVAYGRFSEQILKLMKPRKFYAVDYFNQSNPYISIWGQDHFARDNMPHQQWYERNFRCEIEAGILETRQGFSWDCLEEFPDDYFDYVYVDAAHDYDSVCKDIAVLKRKVKRGGYIQFNDYTHISLIDNEYYGVVPAVNEFVNSGNHEVVFFCFHPRGYNDIVIRKK